MAEQGKATQVDMDKQIKRLAGKARFYAVLFRIILVTGLVLLVTSIGLLIFTELFYPWILVLPVALITLGIFLARVEYRLDLRLYDLQNQEPVDGDD